MGIGWIQSAVEPAEIYGKWKTGWWFQRFFIFTLTWGNDPTWLIFLGWNHQLEKQELIWISRSVMHPSFLWTCPGGGSFERWSLFKGGGFQIFVYFQPESWGRWTPFWRAFFSDGLVITHQPAEWWSWIMDVICGICWLWPLMFFS